MFNQHLSIQNTSKDSDESVTQLPRLLHLLKKHRSVGVQEDVCEGVCDPRRPSDSSLQDTGPDGKNRRRHRRVRKHRGVALKPHLRSGPPMVRTHHPVFSAADTARRAPATPFAGA
jgi:hypothetical protein